MSVDIEVREDRIRLAVVAASGPVLLLLAPVFLPFDGRRSLIEESARDGAVAFLVALLYAAPLYVGAWGLIRGLRRSPAPGKVAYGVPAAAQIVAGVVFAVLMIAQMARRSTMRTHGGLWLMILAAAAVSALALRGFRRSGWDRWAQLVGAVWLSQATFMLAVSMEQRDLFEEPTLAAWIVMFALAAAAPAVGWALRPLRDHQGKT